VYGWCCKCQSIFSCIDTVWSLNRSVGHCIRFQAYELCHVWKCITYSFLQILCVQVNSWARMCWANSSLGDANWSTAIWCNMTIRYNSVSCKCFCRQDVGRRTEGDDQPHGFSGVWMGHPYFTVVLVIGEVIGEVLPWMYPARFPGWWYLWKSCQAQFELAIIFLLCNIFVIYYIYIIM
jgi:hypothetical protein